MKEITIRIKLNRENMQMKEEDTFLKDVEVSRTLTCRAGENLLELLRRERLAPEAPCGGNGTCGKCRVKICNASGEREALACRTTIGSDMLVRIAESRPPEEICSSSESEWQKRRADSLQISGTRWGAAVDLGTTTVAAAFYPLAETMEDPEDGSEEGVIPSAPFSTCSEWNCQIPYGADVITRIQYCMEHKEGLEELASAIRDQTAHMLAETISAAGERELPQPQRIVISGNTVMQHIFAGINPSPIARAPFVPTSLFAEGIPHYFPEFKDTKVFFLPCISGYVGGDITAGLLHTGLIKQEKLTLFLDIGTNGEMAIGNRDGLLCCSTACGPAFEGAQISCGMRALTGAINHVRLRGRTLLTETIGGGRPAGLCGSGLIDLLAILLQEGIVDETGRLPGPAEGPHKWRHRLREDENGNGIFTVYADARGKVEFTAADVRKLQLAKAAVAAGVKTLLKRSGHAEEEVDRVLIAGSFGAHIDPLSMGRIGMLAPSLAGKLVPCGNTSLEGAAELLQNPGKMQEAQNISKKAAYLELPGDSDFAELFIDEMMFE